MKIGTYGNWSFPDLSQSLGFSVSAIHRSLQRTSEAGLYDASRKVVRAAALEEFLVHSMKFLFPPRQTGETRGIPTAWASPRLAGHFAPSDSLPLVWPYAQGEHRGIGLEPLHPAVPRAAAADPELAGRLAIVDALRMGDARLAEVARVELAAVLDHPASVRAKPESLGHAT